MPHPPQDPKDSLFDLLLEVATPQRVRLASVRHSTFAQELAQLHDPWAELPGSAPAPATEAFVRRAGLRALD